MLPALICRRRRAGFTLIELLIVVIIIGILIAIGVPAYLHYVASANDRDAQAALTTAYKAALSGDTEVNTGKFPIASTVVNDVKADEPAAAITRGNCLTGIAAAPVKQVLVDPASTSTQVTMCVKSASGAVWKLSGPLAGTPTISDASTVPLTLAVGNINDTVRAAAVQGDGRSADSSTGVWDATTNLLTNGGCEANTSTWNTASNWWSNPATVTRTTAEQKFGAASCQITTPGTNPTEGVGTGPFAVVSGQTYTISMWAKIPSGQSMRFGIGDSTVGNSLITITGTGSWTRYTATFTATASGTTLGGIALPFGTTATITFYVDGAQVEQHAFATPYVETSGSTASRTNGNAQAPASLISTTQGWVAMRIRVGWAATSRTDFPQLFDWETDTSNRLGIIWNGPSTKWSMNFRNGGGGNSSASSLLQSFTTGTTMTVIGAWYGITLAMSAQGSAFQTAPNAAAVTPSSSTMELGSLGGGTTCDCDILWAATGLGTLTDADAATINSWGDNDPKRASFPSAAQATMVWDGSSSSGSLK